MHYRSKTRHHKRIVTFFFGCVLIFVLLMGRIFYVMIVEGEYYTQKATQLHERERALKAARGRLLDRNGIVVGDNRVVCTVSVIHNQIEEKEKVIEVLSQELQMDEEKIRKRVEKYSSIERIKTKENAFEAIWNNCEPNIITLDFPEIKEEIIPMEEENDEIKEKIIELTPHLEKLKDLITEIKSLFGEDISSCAEAIKANTGNIAKITDGINSTQEQIVKGVMALDHAEIKAAADNLGSIAALITLGGAMMLLGGWILQKNPDLINGSMQFGLVLTTFLLFILTPITLAAVVAGKMGGTFKDFDKIVDFISH